MTSSPAVSVVLIFLNEGRFLPEAVQSILAQTFTDWELLLVDDGSADASSEIARDCARRLPDRVRYMDHPGHDNRGMSASRNLGIAAASGEFLALMDADDVWLPDKLERQVHSLRLHPSVGLIVGRKEFWYSWTGDPNDASRDFLQRLHVPLDSVVSPPRLLTGFLADEYATLIDVLIRRSAVESVGGYEQTYRDLYEDQVFHAKLCAKYPVLVTARVAVRYRQHPQSCVATRRAPDTRAAARRRFFEWLTAYLTTEGVTDPELWRVLRRESLPFRHPRLARAREWVRWVKRRLAGSAPLRQPELR